MNVGYEAVKWLWSTGERFFDVDDEIWPSVNGG
jgi:hypothetical protein